MKENNKKSGIYRWTNKVNGKTYVGSSVLLSRRFLVYYNLIKIGKSNMLIAKALLKYGYSNFSLEILEYCEPEVLISREQYYLDLLKPEYNILTLAGSSLGYKHTEETLAKFNLRTNEHRKGITFSQSEETKAKISKTMTGRKHTEKNYCKNDRKKREKGSCYWFNYSSSNWICFHETSRYCFKYFSWYDQSVCKKSKKFQKQVSNSN